MATISELEAAGELVRVDPQLDDDELEERCIYLLARTAEGLADRLEEMVSELDIQTSPKEQFYELVYHFATGGSLDYPRQFHELRHRRDGIWELKTPDLRLFGWFAQTDCFICSDVANANTVKLGEIDTLSSAGSLYSGYCEQAWFRRDQLNLDQPKFISGDKPENVVSSFHRS